MIIFLDCDGVINRIGGSVEVDFNCVEVLSKIVRKLNAEVVLSSTWRFGFTHNLAMCTPQVKNLRTICQQYGFDIIGRTKNLGSRYDEIRDYLDRHNVSEYLILDDDKNEFPNVKDSHLYYVNSKTGLVSKDIKNILRLLK